MESPCRTCPYVNRSKNHTDCVRCRLRQGAWDGLVRMEAPVSKTTGKTKICSDPECPHGLDPQPVENFRKNHKSPDGHLNTCNACMSRKLRKGHLKKKARQQADADLSRPPDPGAGIKSREEIIQEQGPAAKPVNYQSFEIDFSQNPELLVRLKELARDELRTLENQIVYMLMQQEKRGRLRTWA